MKIDYFKIPKITVSYTDTVKTSERLLVLSPFDVLSFLNNIYKGCMQHHEEFHVLYLNKNNKALGITNISKGGMDNCDVDVRIILQTALISNSSKIILIHNHPSGNAIPSKQDINITMNINKSCKLIGIELVDHIILTSESYVSLVDSGYIDVQN